MRFYLKVLFLFWLGSTLTVIFSDCIVSYTMSQPSIKNTLTIVFNVTSFALWTSFFVELYFLKAYLKKHYNSIHERIYYSTIIFGVIRVKPSIRHKRLYDFILSDEKNDDNNIIVFKNDIKAVFLWYLLTFAACLYLLCF